MSCAIEEMSRATESMTGPISANVETGSVYGKDTMLVTEDFAYPVQVLPNVYDTLFSTGEITELQKNVAYLCGDYYYLYRGPIGKKSEATKPGIYLLKETVDQAGKVNFREFMTVEPETDAEKIEYSYEGRLQNLDPDAIVEQLKGTKQLLKLSIPGSSKIFIPEVCKDDDLLKRAIKEVLIQKNIDIDQYRYRFPDKNALFNFKQVLKKDGAKLSMLLFERGCEALNLKYAIVIEESDPDAPLGLPMEGPIRISSDDTYDL